MMMLVWLLSGLGMCRRIGFWPGHAPVPAVLRVPTVGRWALILLWIRLGYRRENVDPKDL